MADWALNDKDLFENCIRQFLSAKGRDKFIGQNYNHTVKISWKMEGAGRRGERKIEMERRRQKKRDGGGGG